jgi:hypothetical protein
MPISAALLLAVGEVDLNQFYGIIAQSGMVGIFLLLFILGKLRREGEIKDKEAEIAELKATLKEYTGHYQDDVVPALISVTRVAGELVAYLNKHRD